MYLKQWPSIPYYRKSIESCWLQWIHHSEGKTHCQECLMLDGCFFQQGKALPCPHHPYCHCTLEEVEYETVLANASVYSDYSKFDPYLFNTHGEYTHRKEILFAQWGYTVADAQWLQAEMDRQRISIRIEIPRKNGTGMVSFASGWMVCPNGRVRLTTPYGGK